MFMSMITIVLSIIVIAALVVIILLVWQSTVNPYTFDELFVVPAEDALPMQNQEGTTRIVELEGGTNFRDIGGYQTEDGHIVKWGQIYRSARWLQLTDNDKEIIKGLGIQSVVDLRQSEEVALHPNNLPAGIEYHNIPVFEDTPMSPLRVAFNRHRLLDSFKRVYVNHIVERGANTFGKIIHMLLDETNLPLVYHCTAGKDRTGVATAIILMTLGVPRETAVNDYLLSNHSADTFIDQVSTQMGTRNVRGVAIEQLYPLLAASPVLIKGAIDHIENRYGTVEKYLIQKTDLVKDDLEQLRASLLHKIEIA